jgi:predicted metal-binding protein
MNHLSSCIKRLSKRATDIGASDAKVIPLDIVAIEDEVLEMCRKPHCDGYGKSINCPPHVMKPKEFREFVKQYDHAVVFKIDVSIEDMMSEKRNEAFRMIYAIASTLETMAKDEGFEHSIGFAAGSCKPVFCRAHKVCQALSNKSSCRNASVARPSMEAVGINVVKLIRDAGWEIQAIDKGCNPESISNVVLSGLVLVA